ncbi:MAG: exodeoxyribonuclease VII large subunit, partial [Chthoniobacterales bacterium]
SYSERALARELRARFQETTQRLDWRRDSVLRQAHRCVADARVRFGELAAKLRRHDPAGEIALRRRPLNELARRLPSCAVAAAATKREGFERARKILGVLGPEATLARGYGITTDAEGNLIRSIARLQPEARVRTRLSDGEFDSAVLTFSSRAKRSEAEGSR